MIKNIIKNNIEIMIILFLFVSSIALRLLFLNAGLFHHDSVQLAIAVENSINDNTVYPIGGGRYGLVLVNILIFYFFKTFFHHTSAEFAVNFSSALFGALSIPIMYLFVNLLIQSRFIAFSSAMIYSITPIFLSVSTFAKDHTLSVFLVLMSFYLVLKSAKLNKVSYSIYSGIFLGYSLLVRESNIILLLASLYLIFFYKLNKNLERRKIFLGHFIPIAIGIAALLFLILPILKQQIKRSFETFVAEQIAYSLSGILITFTMLGVVLMAIGFIILCKNDKKMLIFLLLWLFPLLAFYTFSAVVDHRFFSEAIIPLAIIISYSLNFFNSILKYSAYFILILLLAWMFLNIYPVIHSRHISSTMKDFSRLIKEKVEDNGVIILYGDNQIFLDYYGDIATIPCEPNLDMESSKEFTGYIYGYLNKNIGVYISTECFSVGTLEEKQHFYNLMLYNFKFDYEFEYNFDNYHKSTLKQDLVKNYLLRVLPYPNKNGKLLSGYMYYPE